MFLAQPVGAAFATEPDRRHFLVKLLAELVDATVQDLPAALRAVVEQIGQFTEVDRVGLVQIDHEAQTMELIHHWHSGRMTPGYTVRQTVPLAEQPSLSARLQNNEPTFTNDVTLMDDRFRVDREMLMSRGIRSNAEVPILLGGQVTGLLFLDDHQQTRNWEPQIPMLLAIGKGIAESVGRLEAAARQQASEQRFQSLFDANPLPVFVIDPVTMVVLEANEAANAVYGPLVVVGTTRFDTLNPHDQRAACIDALHEAGDLTRRSGPWQHRTAHGTTIDVEISARLTDLDGSSALLAVVHDVSAQAALERQLRHQANHDVLTGLPNRGVLAARLDQHTLNGRTAVILLDIDRFKTVNDSFGHQGGDRLLVLAADRLRSVSDETAVVARLGGDEFAVVISAPDALTSARRVAARLEQAFRRPFLLDGRDVAVSASIGLAVSDSANDTGGTLLHAADLAMFAAKESGGAAVVEFSEDLERKAREDLALIGEVRRAVGDDELRLHFQPTVDLASREILGVEALIRWQHPVRGLLSPDKFLPLIENTQLMTRVGTWVLEEACRQYVLWDSATGNAPSVSVNVAPRQLAEPDFVEVVTGIIDRYRIPTHKLVVEITERSLLDDNSTLDRLRALRDAGARIAVDDFGTGYSSLSYLRRLPVDVLKIDRSFVTALDDGTETSEAIVATIVQLANVLKLDTIAEGIETDDQHEILRRIGCRVGQGYLFSRPVPAPDVVALLIAGVR